MVVVVVRTGTPIMVYPAVTAKNVVVVGLSTGVDKKFSQPLFEIEIRGA